jgi:hypothetical protein
MLKSALLPAMITPSDSETRIPRGQNTAMGALHDDSRVLHCLQANMDVFEKQHNDDVRRPKKFGTLKVRNAFC